MELALFFQLFKDKEVVPVAEVLDAGDAVGEGVGYCEFVAATTFIVAGWWNDFFDEALRGFAENAGGFAVGVEVDGAALRRGGFAGDGGCFEGGGVGVSDVAVDAAEEGGVVSRNLVEVLASGEGLADP